MPKPRNKLTYKEQRFVEELIVDWNITRAAEAAGYKSPRSSGYQQFYKPRIRAAIQRALGRQQIRTQISADGALNEMGRIAFCDLRQAFDEKGNPKNIQDIPEDVAKAISSIEVITNSGKEDDEKTSYTNKVRFWDKVKALKEIGNHYNMFTERREHTGKDGGPIEHSVNYEQKLRDAKQRAQQARSDVGDGSGELDS